MKNKAVLNDPRLPERFWKKVSVGSDGCWNWTGCYVRGGYGRFAMTQKTRNRTAHRIAYENIVGLIPEDLELDHLCRNRPCVNPSHLEPVTSKENTLRSPIALAAINSRKTHCIRGHPYNLQNTYIVKIKKIRMCRVCAKLRMRSIRNTKKEN